ncbi:hypothetical protein CO154_00800 [Candidatus Pacearchaeota archaeon CG_4_9_14_3_um_filter_31_7]|nr:MAG: hypothetical protein AUJ10_02490 [Candidatus Pacearchaeota archaeon CG1_02_31_27]PIN92483.1 MAG: hypothetical protein COU55_01615 [Candidatus Pacearchaeota archaeon CG10_big_fil_rev_8_21_14_0_10_31_59]PJA70841.1 MAG: hypothetical protein CO154_00800 [Candidatus Pacearchaeota archaeon CG_4_9_14_3_um_filter_31_7]
MIKVMKISEMLGREVFTDSGDFFGNIEETNLIDNKIAGWRIKISRESNLTPFLGGAKGLIIPHQFVKAIGDVVVVSRAAVPTKEDELKEGEKLV